MKEKRLEIQGIDEEIGGHKTSDPVTFTYDARGNLKKIQSDDGTIGQYYYDATGKMTYSVNKMGITSQYTYDGEGRRVKEAIDASNINVPETSKLHDQDLLELLLADENGLIIKTKKELNFVIDHTSAYNDVLMVYGKQTKLQRYTYGHGLISVDTWNDKVEAWDDLNQSKHDLLLYTTKDMLGSVRALVDESGRVDKFYDYDSFGTPIEKNHVNDQSIRSNIYHYTSYIYDYATSLYFVNARYLAPEIGRFVAEDRYRGDGLNRYVYVNGNPLVNFDPTGFILAEATYLYDDYFASRTYHYWYYDKEYVLKKNVSLSYNFLSEKKEEYSVYIDKFTSSAQNNYGLPTYTELLKKVGMYYINIGLSVYVFKVAWDDPHFWASMFDTVIEETKKFPTFDEELREVATGEYRHKIINFKNEIESLHDQWIEDRTLLSDFWEDNPLPAFNSDTFYTNRWDDEFYNDIFE